MKEVVITKHNGKDLVYFSASDLVFTKPLVRRKDTREIILHCEATPEGKDFTVEQVHKWHLQRGFAGVGYNFIIYRDGTIIESRPMGYSGAHATSHNDISVGISYVGGCDKDGKAKDTRTPEQKASLLELVDYLLDFYGLTIDDVKCHYEVVIPKGSKACPSFKIETFREEYNEYKK